MNNQFGSYFSSGSFTTLPVTQLCQVLQQREQTVAVQMTPFTIQQIANTHVQQQQPQNQGQVHRPTNNQMRFPQGRGGSFLGFSAMGGGGLDQSFMNNQTNFEQDIFNKPLSTIFGKNDSQLSGFDIQNRHNRVQNKAQNQVHNNFPTSAVINNLAVSHLNNRTDQIESSINGQPNQAEQNNYKQNDQTQRNTVSQNGGIIPDDLISQIKNAPPPRYSFTKIDQILAMQQQQTAQFGFFNNQQKQNNQTQYMIQNRIVGNIQNPKQANSGLQLGSPYYQDDEEGRKNGGDFTQLMAVSSLVSNQIDSMSEIPNLSINGSQLQQVQPKSAVQTANLSETGLLMRDQLATKAALRAIDHRKIQDKQRKRQRKTNDQKNILELEYQKDPNWDYEKKCELALDLNFTFAQVSKWNWDRRKKNEAGTVQNLGDKPQIE